MSDAAHIADLEARALAAEAERDAFSKRIDELEALLRAPVRAAATVPPRGWETTAIDRIRAENHAAALDCNGRPIDVSDINRAFFEANRRPPCPCGACSDSAPCPEPDDATTEA